MARTRQLGKTATSVRTENGVTSVRYRNTDVVKFDSKTITLNSGRWLTATTKTRMNQAANQFDLGFQVSQKDFLWTVRLANGKQIEFKDGMTIKRI
jgi:hypothetical protein